MKTMRLSVAMVLAVMLGVMAAPRGVEAQKIFSRGIEGMVGAGFSAPPGGMEAPQVKDELFEGTEKFAQGATDVTEVNMDKNMLGMVRGKGKSDGMSNALATKMDFIVVHSYTYDKPGMYKPEDLTAYRKKLTDGSWNCFIHTRDKDGGTDICSRTMPDNETREMVIMTSEPKELTFVHLRGRMSLEDLGRMGGSAGAAPGASTLKDREKDKDK